MYMQKVPANPSCVLKLLYCSITSCLNATNAAMSLYQIKRKPHHIMLAILSSAWTFKSATIYIFLHLQGPYLTVPTVSKWHWHSDIYSMYCYALQCIQCKLQYEFMYSNIYCACILPASSNNINRHLSVCRKELPIRYVPNETGLASVQRVLLHNCSDWWVISIISTYE